MSTANAPEEGVARDADNAANDVRSLCELCFHTDLRTARCCKADSDEKEGDEYEDERDGP
jgi:hypothetical protein